VSSNKVKQAKQSPVDGRATQQSVKPEWFGAIPYPFLWLALAVLVVYYPVFGAGFTDLDDGIFINDRFAFNSDLHNIAASFLTNVTGTLHDAYYRPLFQVSMILNCQFSGQSIAGYHVVNVLLHIAGVFAFYLFLKQLKISELTAFILSLTFAVHPVLVMAVAWVPGRNDVLLALFVLGFLVNTVAYMRQGGVGRLVCTALFLLLALFTKETAVFAPFAAMLVMWYIAASFTGRRAVVQYLVWVACLAVWLVARAHAHLPSLQVSISTLVADAAGQLPVVVQQAGKALLPFNLSVYPSKQDTVYYLGIVAVAAIVALAYLAKGKGDRRLPAGIALFLLFVLPTLLVPKHLSIQTYEFRLYLPLMGLLLGLSGTILFINHLLPKQLLVYSSAVVLLLAGINRYYQRNFADPLSFWTQAVATAPHSSFAAMMLAARTTDPVESRKLFSKAFELNPNERYVNFIYATILQGKDSVMASEPYLLKEQQITGYYKCDFFMARVARERKEYTRGIECLQRYLKVEPIDAMANLNLLLLYMEADQVANAQQQVKKMQECGLDIPAGLLQQIPK
jgi:tetratricopeptide (TPR) repeat protein